MRRLATRLLAAATDALATDTAVLDRYVPLTAATFSGRATASSAHPTARASNLNFRPGGLQWRSMFIQTQPTPNPASMMFLPGKTVLESGSANFTSAREAMKSPLARKLFGSDGVKQVFFGSDFVTVTKDDDYSWSVLKPDILAAIADHVASGEPLLLDDAAQASSDTAILDDDSEVVAMIKELLDTRIRPSVQEDGGDIQYRGFDEESGVVTLKMQGACSGCPSSGVTLKSGIENMLMHYIPEVKEVREADLDEYEEMGVKEFNRLESQLSP